MGISFVTMRAIALYIRRLFTQAKPSDQIVISVNTLPAEVGQQSSSLPHEHNQATLGVVIMPISCHVACQLFDSTGEQGYLNLG